jgi:hypothetical protein
VLVSERQCYILIPRFAPPFQSELAECRLPNAHTGPHECVLSNGCVICWESDWECDDCDPDDCECFVWWEKPV